MRLALIIDEQRMGQEQSMLNRLCIGLMAEGVQVTRIVPDRALPDNATEAEQRVALAPRLETPMRVLPWMRRSRAERLAEAMEKSIPDVLYAVGQEAWGLGLDLGESLERPVLIDVWSADQVRHAPLPHRSQSIGGYITCSATMAKSLALRVGVELVSVVPMGVSLPRQPRAPMGATGTEAALAVIGGARDLRAYEALFDGLGRIARQQFSLQVFLELHGPHEHDVWRLADRFDLTPCISAIGEATMYRSLVTRCDALVMPERLGEPRSIMLEGMALGIPVISRDDPALDMLIDNDTAVLLRTGDADDWSERILRLLTDADEARRIGTQARAMVATNHRSSDQVMRLIEVIEQVRGGGAIKFAEEQA